MTTDEDDEDIWPTKAQRARAVAQVGELRAQAVEGGLSFDAYLPPDLAAWLLDQIARGIYVSPSDAMFAIVREFMELQPHADLRRELLGRMFQRSLDDPRPSLPAEEVFARLKEKFSQPQPAPAQWQRDPPEDA